MKIIITTLLILFIGNTNAIAQYVSDTGSSSYYDHMDGETTAFYGMKTYKAKDGTMLLFITDIFTLCESTRESDTYKFNNDLESYIKANYYSEVDGANQYLNFSGLSGYTHICYFCKRDNSLSQNSSDAKRGRTNVMAEFQKTNSNYKVKIIKISNADFDFNIACE